MQGVKGTRTGLRLIAIAGAVALATVLPAAAGAGVPVGTITTFTDPSMSLPYGIAGGSDGALWFTNDVGNTIGRISMSGDVTSYSDPEFMRPDLYYADPRFLFDYCKRKLSRHVALLHDYGLYEFTVLVRQ